MSETWVVLFAGRGESVATRWFHTYEINRIAAARKAKRELEGCKIISMRRGTGPWMPFSF